MEYELEQCGNGGSEKAKIRAKSTKALKAAGISREQADNMSADKLQATLEAKGVDKSVIETELARKQEAADAQSAKVAAKIDKEDFQYKGTVSAKEANELLRQLRERQSATNTTLTTTGKTKTTAPIKKYESFEKEVDKAWEKLDKGYNYLGLVPIWHLRKELGDRVDRVQFNDWLMEAQANKKFDLQSGEARGATDAQKRDSVYSDIRGLLFYAGKPDW